MSKLVVLFSLILNAAGPGVPKFFPPSQGTIPVIVNAAAPVSYKNYKQWKDEQLNYWRTRGQTEMAKGLTMADYFAGYLTMQKNQAEAIKQVSSRLSPDEIAELMTIYANSVFGTQSPQLPSNAESFGKQLEKQP
jgi:hypothetical protein